MLAMGPFGYPADYLIILLGCASLIAHAWCFFRFFPRRRHPRVGLVIGNLLVFLCLLGGAGLIAESYLRFVSVATDGFGMSLPARRWFLIHTQLNSLGCRDAEWTREKPPGVRRIAFVGDSFAYGWGIERIEDRFADRIGRMFTSIGSSTGASIGAGRTEILNVAKPGWGTRDQIQPIADMISLYDVDEIVLCHVPNDIEKLLPTSPDFNPTRPPQPRWFNPEFSCLLDYLYRGLVLPRLPTVRGYDKWLADGYADPAIQRVHRSELEAIVERCRRDGVTLRVVLLPLIGIDESVLPIRKIHGSLRSILEGMDMPVVDLLPAIQGHTPRELTVSSRDAHPNELANELFAQAIWRAFYAQPAP